MRVLDGRMGRTVAPGFSLVELLVVISIIALLVSVLLPALSQARGAALESRCQSQVRQTGIGVLTYAVDYNDQVTPHFNYVTGSTTTMYQGLKAPDTLWAYHANTSVGPYKLRAGLTWPDYVRDARVFYCPDSRHPTRGQGNRNDMIFSNSPSGVSTGFKFFGLRNDYSGQFDVSYAFPAVNVGPVTRTAFGGISAAAPNYWATTGYWNQFSTWGSAMLARRVADNASLSNAMLWDNNTDSTLLEAHGRRVTVVGYFDGSGLKYPQANYVFATKSHSIYNARGFTHPSVLQWFRDFKIQGTLVQ